MAGDSSRRAFLRTVVVSGGTAGLAGCNRSPDADADAAGAPTAVDPDPVAADRNPAFPQSVASGDPRPESVVLWTRVEPTAVDADPDRDVPVRLEVAPSADFADPAVERDLRARAAHDHCLRVKVVDLAPGRSYRYRFRAGEAVSPAGRTRTAPAPDADRPVTFGVASCQDRAGRYYNAYLALLARDLDFVVHLGDYVYETTGGTSFQRADADRGVSFRQPGEAIDLGRDGAGPPALAARSLSNYRDLYRTYRSDPVLRRVHERFPTVHVWDDHEFSDDAWGAHATYSDGRRSAADRDRRRNAERAFFEYQPVDPARAGPGPIAVGEGDLYPDTRIYRDLRFGRHLHLLLTDYRTYRPDHLLPEDAFPGTIVMTEGEVVETIDALLRERDLYETLVGGPDGLLEDWFGVDLDALLSGPRSFAARELFERRRDSFRPYVDLDAPAYDRHRRALAAALADAYRTAGLDGSAAGRRAEAVAAGRLDATVVDDYLREAGAFEGDLEPVGTAGLPRGVSYAMFGKRSLFGSLGSRYLVVKPTFDLYAVYRAAVRDAAVEPVLGADQRDWLLGPDGDGGVLLGDAGDATWKVLGSSVSLTSMVLDLGNPPADLAGEAARLPGPLQNAFYLNVDQWDGFPNRRRALLDSLRALPDRGLDARGAVALSGDIHAAFATDFGRDGFPAVEFTGTSVSSGTLRSLVQSRVDADPDLAGIEGIDGLVRRLDDFLADGNGDVELARSHANGVLVVEAGREALSATFHLLPAETAFERHYDRPEALADRWTTRRFRVDADGLREVD